MKKHTIVSLLSLLIFLVLGITVNHHNAEAGLLNRQGTWKEEYEESDGGFTLTVRDRCKWSIWKSECSSAGEGEVRNEEVYTL